MPKVNSITPALLKELRAKIDAALTGLGDEYGIAFRTGNAKYDGLNGSFKLELALKDDEKGVVMTQQANDFKRYMFNADPEKGLVKDDLFKEFTHNRTRYKVVGYRASARKNPILIEKIGGGQYTASEDMVFQGLRPEAWAKNRTALRGF
jgi:hypothetical protein